MKDEFESLTDQWLEGWIEEAKQIEFAEWLKEHPKSMRDFVEANIRNQMLREAVRCEFVAEEVREAVVLEVKPARNFQALRIASSVVAAAACLLVALIWNLNSGADVQKLEPFSTVMMVHEFDGNLTERDRLGAETIEITRGIVRLQFDDGVEVTLQGPAKYELIAPGKTRLHSGLLTAIVPPGAEGFQVDTPNAKVIDLGTAFGIEQNPDGTSLVSVFDGEIKVVRQDNSGSHFLTEGKAIQLTTEGSINNVKFSTESYDRLWPLATAISRSSGAFRFAPLWPRQLRRIRSDTEIYIFPEGYAKRLEQPCPIDFKDSERVDAEIPTGRRVRSFLLQFKPTVSSDGELKGNGEKIKRIAGSITFERPVIGLIFESETLKETDELFAQNRDRVPTFKSGLEFNSSRLADFVSLSEDSRTLTLKLVALERFSDHLRVIVDASLVGSEAN